MNQQRDILIHEDGGEDDLANGHMVFWMAGICWNELWDIITQIANLSASRMVLYTFPLSEDGGHPQWGTILVWTMIMKHAIWATLFFSYKPIETNKTDFRLDLMLEDPLADPWKLVEIEHPNHRWRVEVVSMGKSTEKKMVYFPLPGGGV